MRAVELVPGARLARYQLLCPIAAGGMANLWVARPAEGHGAGRLVAVKTILPKFASEPRFQEMFLREGGIAARITHKNVARIFDLGEVGGVLYIAMEYVDGESLSRLGKGCSRKGVRIPPGIVLRVLADVSSGLHHAHELRDGTGRLLNVVHRDVSPSNILLDSRGVAKLIDFGIAKTNLRFEENSEPQVLKGKVRYMSPEQALGISIDRRADIWAIGAILYDALAGRPPYEAENPMATLKLIASGERPAPLPREVHRELAALVGTALAYEPDRRFATAAQLQEALELAMHSGGIETSVADVAAFAAQYLGERTEKRRHSVEIALAQARDIEHPRGAVSPKTGPSEGPHPAAVLHRSRWTRTRVAFTLAVVLAGFLAAALGGFLWSYRMSAQDRARGGLPPDVDGSP